MRKQKQTKAEKKIDEFWTDLHILEFCFMSYVDAVMYKKFGLKNHTDSEIIKNKNSLREAYKSLGQRIDELEEKVPFNIIDKIKNLKQR